MTVHNDVQADKAIIALHLLAVKPGMGANRMDRPKFRQLVARWTQGRGGHKDAVVRARARIRKYTRQLQSSPYWPDIINPSMSRAMMLQRYNQDLQRQAAEYELHEYIKAANAYGNW